MSELLTFSQKNAIRDSACRLCLALPPFPDGSRCHVHRIIRGRDGGLYVADNVLPLCPPCHAAVDRMVVIAATYRGIAARKKRTAEFGFTDKELLRHRQFAAGGSRGAVKGYAKGLGAWRAGLTDEQFLEHQHATTRKAVEWQQRHPELHAAIGRKGAQRAAELHGTLGKRAGHLGGKASRLNERMTPEEHSRNSRKGGKLGGHTTAAIALADPMAWQVITRKAAAVRWERYRRFGPSEKMLAAWARQRGKPHPIAARHAGKHFLAE